MPVNNLLVDPQETFRQFREKINTLTVTINNNLLEYGNNLSDVQDIQTALDNLSLYRRDQLYTQTESNARYYEEDKAFSENADTPELIVGGDTNAQKRRKQANNLDMYIQNDVYTKTETNDTFLNEDSNLSDLPNLETSRVNLNVYSRPEVRNGTLWNNANNVDTDDAIMIDSNIQGLYNRVGNGTFGDGTLVGMSSINTRFQLFAPHKINVTNPITSVSQDISGLYVRTGLDNDLIGWEQINTVSYSDAHYFKKSDLFSELATNTIQQRTATDNLDVYQKEDVYTKAESNGNYVNVNGDTMTGNLTFNNGVKSIFGTGDALQIYNNGVDSFISNNVGGQDIYFNVKTDGGDIETCMTVTGEIGTSRVNLYAGNVIKMYTSVNGVTVNGNVSATGTVSATSGMTVNGAVVFHNDNVGTLLTVGQLLGGGYNQSEADNKFSVRAQNLSDLTDNIAARTNLQVYSQIETDNALDLRFLKTNLFNEVPPLSIADRATLLDNLDVYSRADIDAEFQTGATTSLTAAQNLADLLNVSTARINLGLTEVVTHNYAVSNTTPGYNSGDNSDIARGDHYHLQVFLTDNRTVNEAPDDFDNQMTSFNYKQDITLGITGRATSLSAVQNINPNTGYNFEFTPHQVAYTADSVDGRMKHRHAISGTNWSTWETIAYLSDKVADTVLFDGETKSSVRDYNNLLNVPTNFSFDDHDHDLDYVNLSGDSMQGTLFLESPTTLVTGGIGARTISSDWWFGDYNNSNDVGHSFLNNFTGQYQGIDHTWDLHAANASTTGLVGMNQVWSIKQSGNIDFYNDISSIGNIRMKDGGIIQTDRIDGVNPSTGTDSILSLNEFSGQSVHINGNEVLHTGNMLSTANVFSVGGFNESQLLKSDRDDTTTGKLTIDSNYLKFNDDYKGIEWNNGVNNSSVTMDITGTLVSESINQFEWRTNTSSIHTGGIQRMLLLNNGNLIVRGVGQFDDGLVVYGTGQATQINTGMNVTGTLNANGGFSSDGSNLTIIQNTAGEHNVAFRSAPNTNSNFFLTESDHSGLVISYNGTSNKTGFWCRNNVVDTLVFDLPNDGTEVNFIGQPKHNGVNLATVNDKAPDSELIDGLNSTQFIRSDVSSVLSGTDTTIRFGPGNSGLLGSANFNYIFKNEGIHTSIDGDGGLLFMGANTTDSIILGTQILTSDFSKVIATADGTLYDKGTTLETKYARRNGEIGQDFISNNSIVSGNIGVDVGVSTTPSSLSLFIGNFNTGIDYSAANTMTVNAGGVTTATITTAGYNFNFTPNVLGDDLVKTSVANANYLGINGTADNSALLDNYTLSDSNIANTVVRRSVTGDIHASNFRSESPNSTSAIPVGAGIAYRNNNSTDNFVRYNSNLSEIRTFIDVYAKSEALSITGKAADTTLFDGSSLSTTSTALTVPKRDSNGDIHSKLFRSEHINQSTMSGGIAFRVNDTTDNGIKICNDPESVKDWLGLEAIEALAVIGW